MALKLISGKFSHSSAIWLPSPPPPPPSPPPKPPPSNPQNHNYHPQSTHNPSPQLKRIHHLHPQHLPLLRMPHPFLPPLAAAVLPFPLPPLPPGRAYIRIRRPGFRPPQHSAQPSSASGGCAVPPPRGGRVGVDEEEGDEEGDEC